jgi:hypothetical protein
MSEREGAGINKLARRFQAAIDQEAAAARIAEEQARTERERLEQVRAELLDSLEAFGRQVSWFEVEREEGAVTLRYGKRSIRFEAVGGRGRVKVEADGLEGVNKLYLQEPMDRWVWSREDRYGREHREMLFDAGLEKLLSVVFEVAPLAEEEFPLPAEESGGGEEPEERGGVPFPAKTL